MESSGREFIAPHAEHLDSAESDGLRGAQRGMARRLCRGGARSPSLPSTEGVAGIQDV